MDRTTLTQLLDVAGEIAGTAIAVEAGCAVTDPAGRPLAYDPAAGLRHPAFLVYPKGMELEAL